MRAISSGPSGAFVHQLTGSQRPSPYVLDRVESMGQGAAVLMAPHDTVTSVGLLDEL